jgi:hypothetical protein
VNLSKLLSGRYILTLICGLVFAYGAIIKLLPADAVVAIVSMVFISYFQRTDRKGDKIT